MTIELLLHVIVLVFCYMSSIFCIALFKRDNSIVDVAWGIGFMLISYMTLLESGSLAARKLLITLMTTIWGLRLSGHILYRNWGRGEDKRYALWRKQWGNNVFIRSFLQVFMLQGIVMIIIASPIILINSSHNSFLNLLDLTGVVIWLIGFSFEAIGDYQLHNFMSKSENKNKIMTDGVWKYSRHPNYFGEVTLWWGMFLIALSVPWGWTTIISPLTITYLILYISGIPMTEKFFETNPDFIEYKKRTSAFFPWFYKKPSSSS